MVKYHISLSELLYSGKIYQRVLFNTTLKQRGLLLNPSFINRTYENRH